MAHHGTGKRRFAARDEAPFPPAFLERLTGMPGAEPEALVKALDAVPPVSIRLNPLKPFPIQADQVPWCTQGRYLPERPSFTLDPLLHAGAYYVQEAASMLLEQAVLASGAMQRDTLALDLCGAPGGKTTHLLSLLTPGSLVIANEVEPGRRRILAENCWKWGAPNVAIAGSDPAALEDLSGIFDLIVVDAPCSGEGLFRRDPFARRQWSPQLVQQCAAVQQRIVEQAWDALAPGGTIIYSTCTWELEEDEARMAQLLALGAEPLPLPISAAWGVVPSERDGAIAYRCYPHRLQGEGFFLFAARKPGQLPSRDARPVIHRTDPPPWIDQQACLSLVERAGIRYARPAAWAAALDRIAGALALEAPGIPVAERKGDGWVPHAAAALSALRAADHRPVLDLSLPEALAYLRGAALSAADAQGTALVRHRGLGLGWAQGAGRRWNNRWPSPWRIRMLAAGAPPVPWSEP